MYFVNHIYSIGILVTVFIAILSFVALFIFRTEHSTWLTYVKENAINLYLTLLIIATVGSLFYSEIADFTPCKLCWIQRIFIFPQILIILVSKFNKKKEVLMENIWGYLSWMTGFGLFFTIIHNYIYYFGKETSATCDAAASCKAYYMYEYGIVTIPFMALGLLVSLATIFFIKKYYRGYKKIDTTKTEIY
jgi:disulfide bond formation protein DsbB